MADTNEWLDDIDFTISTRSYREVSELGANVLIEMRLKLSDKAKAAITAKMQEIEQSAEMQGAINAIYRFKAERIEHTLSNPAEEWERELETADRVLLKYTAELKRIEELSQAKDKPK